MAPNIGKVDANRHPFLPDLLHRLLSVLRGWLKFCTNVRVSDRPVKGPEKTVPLRSFSQLLWLSESKSEPSLGIVVGDLRK
jgi:hypothetical protein